MQLLFWALLLLAGGLTLAALEIFIPSGGVLGILAGLAIVLAIILAFLAGPWIGLAVAGTTVVVIPAILAVGFKVWPETPFGRRILLPVPTSEEVLPDEALLRELKQLVGRVGVAKSLMLPSGAVQIGDRTIDALAQGMAIEPGQKVRVVEVHGTRVMVRPADDEPTAAQTDTDPLSRPIKSLGLDDLEEPLA